MLEYGITVVKNQCLIQYSAVGINRNVDPEGSLMIHFDEDHIRNRTIEVSSTKPSNAYFVVTYSNDILIGNIYEADCIAELAEKITRLTRYNKLFFACKMRDEMRSVVVTDSFAAVPPVHPGIIGPIPVDEDLMSDIASYINLLNMAERGEYPEYGYEVIDHEGGLQPWYPEGGLKGHKRKLLENGFSFVDEYKVDTTRGDF